MTRRPGDGLRVAVLGLGEAGSAIAAGLVGAGAEVAGWDPDSARRVDGVRQAEGAADAVRDADVVLGLSSAAAATRALEGCASGLAPGVLYADLNTTSPQHKRELAALAGRTGAVFVDVALMAPVPAHGLGTPALASGEGAERFSELLRPVGMPVEVVGSQPGEAALRKLLRSVFMKGLAASALESLASARAAGCEPWLRGEVEQVLAGADASLLERLVRGSERHAARRTEEMEAAAALQRELGVEPRVTLAAAATLGALAEAGR